MPAFARDEISRGAATTILLALLAFVALGHGAWLAADSSLSGYDELAFFDHLTKYQTLLRQEPPTHWLGFLDFSSYPALPFLAGALAMRVGGPSVTAVRLTGVIFHLLWMLAAYGVGRRLSGRLAGLVASAAIGLSPLATILARHYASFLPHAALSMFAVYVLLRTKEANGWKGALPVGVACSLALLSERGTPLLFLAGPIAWAIALRLLGPDRRAKHRVLMDFALAAAIAAVIAGPYLVGFIRANWGHTVALSQHAVNAGRDAGYYFDRVRNTLIGPALFPLLPAAVLLGAWRRERRLLLPALWLAVPLFALSSVATKDMVYALSMTSPLAVACGLGAALLPRGVWRWPVLAALLFFALLGWVRVGDPTLPLARSAQHVRFLGLHEPSVLPADRPRREFDARRLLAAVREVDAKTDDVWVLTGASLTPSGSAGRPNVGDALRIVMVMNRIPGRFLLTLSNVFPGRVRAEGEDQHFVLAPAAAAPPGSTAAYLARPAFALGERGAIEPKLIAEWRGLVVRLVRVTGLEQRRLFLYRASASSPAAAEAVSPPVAAAGAP